MPSHILSEMEKELALSREAIVHIASLFREHMKKGLSGQTSSLKMLPSYLGTPTGQEKGVFLALDFGGSNVRASLVKLKGKGRFEEFSKVVRPLSDPVSGHDYRLESVTAGELFDFLTGIIHEALINQDVLNASDHFGMSLPIPLGFSFSFPYRQQRIDQGILLHWDKEVKTSGVIGQDVGALLTAALARRGLGTLVKPAAIINDTTATFLTAAYQDPSVEIAAIIGTGHNTCYLEPQAPGFGFPVIINTESGNFSEAPATVYDHRLDQESDNPGEQKFEKMLSGKYLGELFRLIVQDFFNWGVPGLSEQSIPELSERDSRWTPPYSISGKDLSQILTAAKSLDAGTEANSLPTAALVAHILTKRSARLAASGLIGIIRHLDPHLAHRHTVAIDGSLYEGMPGYAQELSAALYEGLESQTDRVTVRLSPGGSLTGAAIAAALVK